uniref:Tonsoku-like protein n=1 Tax=Lepisosteus oculatus TaxID=7918 RepID=W5MF24_LEPOC|nr:PREDICTED: tonsoku-like protein [Lepisosteus oculatus]
MSFSREIKQLQKAKTKAQSTNNLREEANLCNQLGELLAKNGDFQAAIEEHRQELVLSEVLHDVIGCAVANRKIGECFAELGNIEAALKHQRRHLSLACSVNDAAEEQRALATIGRTFLYRYESDQSQDSLLQAEEAFKKSLAIVDERLEGAVPPRELSEMRARLYLNLGFVYDGLRDPQRCNDFIRRSVFIAEKNQLLEDLYRANFNLGSIHFRNGQHSRAVRCLEQAKECARKLKDKYCEGECYHSIGQVLLSLGDFVAARRSLKKAFKLGSQQAAEKETVKKNLKHAIRGCALEEGLSEVSEGRPQEAVGLAEQLGDLCCKVGCFSKALEAYSTQLSSAISLGKPDRELAVIHVSLAATYTDLRKHDKAIQHYRQELALREGNPREECETWLNIAASLEESAHGLEELEPCYSAALQCAQRAEQPRLQYRVLKQLLCAQQRAGSSRADGTASRLQELCGAGEWSGGESEEELEGEENSEPLEESDLELSDSDDEDLEGYDKMVTGRRKTSRWNRRNEKGETPLHRACIDGNLKQVQYLVEQGHPVNPRDYCGWTPLHEACNHGHLEIVRLLLERGANVNDPGGPMCEGITPLHDALGCGHFLVARLLVEKGASVNARNTKGETPQDGLRHWLKMYSKHLDQETRQDCVDMERLLKSASVRGVLVPKAAVLQDSELFDAENSEPLVSSGGRCSQTAQPTRDSGRSPGRAGDFSDLGAGHHRGTRRYSSSSVWPRGGEDEWESDTVPSQRVSPQSSPSRSEIDSDSSVSPLRPVCPRLRLPASPVPTEEVLSATGREAEAPAFSGREEYQRAMRGLGSAKSRLLSQGLSEQELSTSAAVSVNGRSALVREEEYVDDDWLEDDIGAAQPRKRRRVGSEQEMRRETPSARSETRGQNNSSAAPEVVPKVPSGASRGLSLRRGGSRVRQVKMTQLSGMVVLGRRDTSRPQSPVHEPPTWPSQPSLTTQSPNTQSGSLLQPVAAPLPLPIRVRVRVQDNVFLIPIPHSEAESCTVSWLCEQAAQRYYQACGLQPRLSLQKEGALLAPQDLLLTVLHSNEEVLAEVTSWDLPPLLERYRKACQSLAVDENKRVCRLCEVQDGSPTLSVSGLSLSPLALTPLLRCLKLQSCLKELRLSGNRLRDDLMAELVATATTLPNLHILDLSANHITGEGLKKASATLDGRSQPAFPCLEELDLSVNPLGDGVSQALSCLLSACPLLATLKLQGCGLSTRFLQQHRLLLASSLSGTGHLKSVCLSHNSLGSIGMELVLKTLPLHSLTHLDLSAIRRGPADSPSTEHLAAHLSQEGCSLIHLSLAGNGLKDSDLAALARCLTVCPTLVSLDLSGNPGVTAAGLETLLSALRESQRPLRFLNLAGCLVSGPWDSTSINNLSACVWELRLCSQRLNKLDREELLRRWSEGAERSLVSRLSKCFIRAAAPLGDPMTLPGP